jgi:protein O-GlcNAc transferase
VAAVSTEVAYRAAEQHFRGGQLEVARELCQELLVREPAHVDARRLLALTLLRTDRRSDAVTELRRALQLRPKDASLLANLGSVLSELGRHDEAIGCLRQAQQQLPGSAPLQYNVGNAYMAGQCHKEALVCFAHAIALQPSFAAAHNNLGVCYRALGDAEHAMASFRSAIALKPTYAEAHANLGALLAHAGRHAEAVSALKQAVLLDARDEPSMVELRRALVATGELASALALFEHGVTAASADYHNEYGCALLRAGRPNDALRHFDTALRINPQLAEPHLNRASALIVQQQWDEALVSAETALRLSPELAFAESVLWNVRARLCDWGERDALTERMRGPRSSGARVHPYDVLMASDDPDVQRTAARGFAPARAPAARRPTAQRKARARIAYLSADLRADHPVGNSFVEVLERHDKSRFEIVGVSLAGRGIAACPRIRAACDDFIEGHEFSDEALAAELRRREVDLAVDLMGYTVGSRPGIFAAAPAPVTASYLGYPGTQGSASIDYLITDRFVVPAAAQALYDEHIASLPECFFPTDTLVQPAEAHRRTDAALPESALVLCAFCNTAKIAPPLFDAWMALLRALPQAVLWLAPCAESARRNLRRETEARSVDPERLVFARRIEPRSEYLAHLALADLFLDTYPYNGHSSARDALWAGVPVLTCAGRSFASRVAGSLLHGLGMRELVASDLEDYVARGLELTDRSRLAALRAHLATARERSAVFDMTRLCRQLESLYTALLQRAVDRRSPEHCEIEPLP